MFLALSPLSLELWPGRQTSIPITIAVGLYYGNTGSWIGQDDFLSWLITFSLPFPPAPISQSCLSFCVCFLSPFLLCIVCLHLFDSRSIVLLYRLQDIVANTTPHDRGRNAYVDALLSYNLASSEKSRQCLCFYEKRRDFKERMVDSQKNIKRNFNYYRSQVQQM